MSGQKNQLVTFGFAASLSLVAAAVAVLITSFRCSRLQFDLLNVICGEIVEQDPEARDIISAVLKEYIPMASSMGAGNKLDATAFRVADITEGNPDSTAQEDFLSALGYGISDFPGSAWGQDALSAAAGLLAGILLFALTYFYRNKKEALRIRALIAYLEQANMGKAAILSASGEDEFSRLEDEIYKTVTYLYHTRDSAVRAKNDFAENLSNIAHQIKTPITAISLSVQMLKRSASNDSPHSQSFHEPRGNGTAGHNRHLEQVEKQLRRLTRLEEALLVLARIDAGTLELHRDEVDVFTLLVLAADNLQELLASSHTAVDIPEQNEMSVAVDLDWTMEAVMNVMKNCMEHSPGGTIHCSYAQNPLYTEILIWDEGDGFAKEDLPHIFERFYRGRNAGEGGIGIGLALSKEMIERQNGTIGAKNRPEGGALFEIRFYSH